jgi:type II secretory pathway pseudopilin PulG
VPKETLDMANNQLENMAKRRHRRKSCGFTLIEATISLLLMGMLLLGSINLFIGALRNTIDAQALVYSNQDASAALQTIVDKTREAYYFQLPDEAAFAPPAGTSAGSYQTQITVSGGSETVCTGMLITMPNKSQSVSVALDSGSTSVPGFYYRDQGTNGLVSGQQILYYRSDPDGTPDAAAGTCLWALTVSDNDGSSPTFNQALIKTVAPLPNAIQFVRPQSEPNSLGVTTSIPYEVEIKIICSSYAPTSTAANGSYATNEVSNGGSGSTYLDGKCVFMRDHELSATNESGSTAPLNNRFVP